MAMKRRRGARRAARDALVGDSLTAAETAHTARRVWLDNSADS